MRLSRKAPSATRTPDGWTLLRTTHGKSSSLRLEVMTTTCRFPEGCQRVAPRETQQCVHRIGWPLAVHRFSVSVQRRWGRGLLLEGRKQFQGGEHQRGQSVCIHGELTLKSQRRLAECFHMPASNIESSFWAAFLALALALKPPSCSPPPSPKGPLSAFQG